MFFIRRIFLGSLPLVLLLAHTAKAQPKYVFVEQFLGPHSEELQRRVMSHLRKGISYQVVDASELSAYRRRFRVRTMREKDWIGFAKKHRISAFVAGTVERRRRRRWEATLTVRSAADSRVVGTHTWRARNSSGLLRKGKQETKKVLPFMLSTRYPGEAPPKPPKARPSPGNPSPGNPSSPSQPKSSSKKRAASPWLFEDQLMLKMSKGKKQGNTKARESAQKRVPRGRDPRWQAIYVQALFGTLNRTMVGQLKVYDRGRTANANYEELREERNYAGSLPGHLEGGLAAEFYPGVQFDLPWLRPLGIALSYRQSLLLGAEGCALRSNLAEPCSDQERISIGTSQSELYFGLKGKFYIVEEEQSLQLVPQVGIGIFRFDFNLDDLRALELPSVIPPLVYQYLQLGLEIRYELVPRYLELGAYYAFRGGLAPPDPNRIWGTDTEPASGFSLGVNLKSDAPYLFNNAFWTFGLEWFRFTTKFNGQAGCGLPGGQACSADKEDWENNEPWELFPADENGDVNGGPQADVDDTYIRLSLGLGWAFTP